MTDLKDGETAQMQGSGKNPYTLKNIGGIYSCSCPAWRNQSNSIDLRTCKHIIKLRGEDAERSRLGAAFPEKNSKKVSKSVKSTVTVQRQADAEANKPPLLLAHTWTDEDPTGWWMSEKLDGVRAYWDGKNFISRLGNIYHAPDWFKAGLPRLPLDGELFVARGEFQRCVSIVRRQDKSDDWKEVKYIIFDIPALNQPFEDRWELMKSMSNLPSHVQVLFQDECKGVDHLRGSLKLTEALGGEGLMLREPGSMYEEGRSTTLLKVKTFYDAEAVVIGHSAGKGRHKGRLGALECRCDSGAEFSVGSGLSDQDRENPPPIGTIITYRYQELTKDGKPRFPTFLRVREDI